MFERFTEKARRVIFFARFEASQYGSRFIETEHILLGLMREDKALAQRLRLRAGSLEALRKEIESRITPRERISTSIEIPLTADAKQTLHFALEEAERLGHKHVGTEHLLLGLLRADKTVAAVILNAQGITLSDFRTSLTQGPGPATMLSDVMPHVAEGATIILQPFLSALRSGRKDESRDFFSSKAQFIDARGKRWAGKTELQSKFVELFAPFAARDAKYVTEEIIQVQGGLWVEVLLWENVPLPEKTPKGLCRMTVMLGQTEVPEPGWVIHSVQVTPITGI
jgi:Clp amino terminal domain, pathogenicity island component